MNREEINKIMKLLKKVNAFATTNEVHIEEMDIGIVDKEFEFEKPEKSLIIKEASRLYDISKETSFSAKYFMDGVQRTFFLGHIFCDEKKMLLPLDYVIAGAIILKRENRKLIIHDKILSKKFIIPPKKYLSNDLIDLIDPSGYIEITEKDIEYYGDKLRTIMNNNYVSKERAKLEQNIVKKFNEEIDDWLVIDGSLNARKFITNEKFMDSPKKIGIVKRHPKRYFSREMDYEMMKLFSAQSENNKNVRSQKFTFSRKINGESINILSCYTRLFQSRDPHFGLIRVELLEEYEDIFDDVIKYIFNERLPVSYPATLWHKKIYAIKECEEFLNVFLPSTKEMKKILGIV